MGGIRGIGQKVGLEVVEGHGDGGAESPQEGDEGAALRRHHLRGVYNLSNVSNHSVIVVVAPMRLFRFIIKRDVYYY